MEQLKETDIHTMQDLLEVAEQRYRDEIAVKTLKNGEIKAYTYGELYRLTGQYQIQIQKLDVSEDAKIVMLGDVSLCWVCCYFAVTTMGFCAVPLDKSLSDPDIIKKALYSDAEAIILTEDNDVRRQNLAALENRIAVIDKSYFAEINSEAAKAAVPKPDKNRTAAMIFTSGTTGESKAVLLSHQNICHNVYCVSKRNSRESNAGMSTVPVLPTHHMFQITVGILVPLYTGMTLCINENPRLFMQSLQVFQPATLTLVPAIIDNLHKKLLDIGPEEFRKLTGGRLATMKSGGASLSVSVTGAFQQAGIDIIVGYGITECSPVVAAHFNSNPRYDTVGKVLPPPYCEVKIIDGEICVKGSIVMKGYYKNDAETEKAFLNGWFRTGDLGELNSEGELILTGRIKNLIILSDGNNVSPEELERILMNMEYVSEALVKEVRTAGKQMIGAEVYAKQSDEAVKQNILNQIDRYNKSVPMYKRIYDITFRDKEFEKTSLGKIRRVV